MEDKKHQNRGHACRDIGPNPTSQTNTRRGPNTRRRRKPLNLGASTTIETNNRPCPKKSNAGDDLQGIKKGIMELADALVINKADGESVNLATMTRKHYTAAMTLLRHALHWSPQVMTCSALQGDNIDAVWEMVLEYERAARANDVFQIRRDRQSRDWMHHLIGEMLQLKLQQNPAARALVPQLEEQVVAQTITPYAAARQIIDCL